MYFGIVVPDLDRGDAGPNKNITYGFRAGSRESTHVIVYRTIGLDT